MTQNLNQLGAEMLKVFDELRAGTIEQDVDYYEKA